jgi:hypothetical protein
MTPQEQYIAAFKRLLYLKVIVNYTQVELGESKYCPEYLREYIIADIKKFRYFYKELQWRNKNTDFNAIEAELSKDKLHDLALHIDTMMKIENISDITEAILKELS